MVWKHWKHSLLLSQMLWTVKRFIRDKNMINISIIFDFLCVRWVYYKTHANLMLMSENWIFIQIIYTIIKSFENRGKI